MDLADCGSWDKDKLLKDFRRTKNKTIKPTKMCLIVAPKKKKKKLLFRNLIQSPLFRTNLWVFINIFLSISLYTYEVMWKIKNIWHLLIVFFFFLTLVFLKGWENKLCSIIENLFSLRNMLGEIIIFHYSLNNSNP